MIFIHRPSYLKRIIGARDWARVAVFLAFVLLGIGVIGGSYAGFLRGFRFFRDEAYFSGALAAYTMEATFFIIAVLVFASAIVGGFSTLFASRENQFLLSTPLQRQKLFWSRFFENALMAAWPLVLVGVPAVIAFARVHTLSLASHLLFWLMLALALFSIIAASSLIDLALVRMMPSLGAKIRFALLGLLIIVVAYLLGRAVLPINLNELFYAESFTHPAAPTDLIFAHFQITPTHAAVEALFLEPKQIIAAGAAIGVLLAAGAALALLWYVSGGVYARTLMRSFEGLFVARAKDASRRLRLGFSRFPVLCTGARGALIEKDVVGFVRSSRETLRALLLVFMLCLYLFLYAIAFRRFLRDGLEIPFDVLGRMLVFNLAVIGYFTTTLAIRFVFPLFSLEGRGAWAVFSSPVKRAQLLWEKLVIGIVPLLAVIVPLAAASAAFLGFTGFGMAVFMRSIVWMCVAIIVLALSFGALFPNFRESDPDRLSTTVSGLALTALSLVYVALAAAIGFYSIRAYLVNGALFPPVIWLFLVVTAVTILLPFRLAMRRLRTLDIAA